MALEILKKTFTFTAIAAQTEFTGTDDNGEILIHADNSLVYLNGIRLTLGDGFTATSGAIQLTSGAAANDVLTSEYYYLDDTAIIDITSLNIPSTVSTSIDADTTINGDVTITGEVSVSGSSVFTGTTTFEGSETIIDGDLVVTGTTSTFVAQNTNEQIFSYYPQEISTDYTIPSTKNALTAGPVKIASGTVITVKGNWSIV